MELCTLVKQLNEKFDLPAQAMIQSSPVSPIINEQVEEQTSFNVIIEKLEGDKKTNAIKVLRKVTSLGLSEAKDIVVDIIDNNKSYTVLSQVNKEQATEVEKQFVEAGITVSIQ
jgi:large subunit ribosomal protein L7/L12